MAELRLDGCTPEPLMSYLKALGLFRLVSEQVDPGSRLSWPSGVARLEGALDGEQLLHFFLNDYRPTPIVAPWNGGSGFYGSGESIEAIARSTTPRLSLYRAVIGQVRQFVPPRKPQDNDKQDLLAQCRAELPDEVVPWLDVCFVLGEEKTSFFPLLGTGGNDGRLDFTNNFMQRLMELIPGDVNDRPSADASALLAASVFANALVPLRRASVGQFNPGGIGGANGIQGKFEADSRINPWDYVLMMEGAILFAGSVARRLNASGAGRAVFPFTVESVAVGYGSATATEETSDGSRAELWLPLWTRPATLPEVRQLFAEGRAQAGRRQARTALDFSLAVNLLGVNRGVEAFVRTAFLKRNGLAYLATPLGRTSVTPRPSAQLLLDPPLTEWLDRFRSACRDKDKTPARYQSALRQVERALFAFSNRSELGNDGPYLRGILAALGRAERTLARGTAFCEEKYIRPLQGLSAEWLAQAAGDSPEFRLAASLAANMPPPGVLPLRAYLEPIEVRKFVGWAPGSTAAAWSQRPPADNLAAVFLRRQLDLFRTPHADATTYWPRPAALDDIVLFLNGQTDDAALGDLLWGLIAVDVGERFVEPASSDVALPLEYMLPRLLLEGRPFAYEEPSWRLLADEPIPLNDPEVFDFLRTPRRDAVARCAAAAAGRLRSFGFVPVGYRNRAAAPVVVRSPLQPRRLLASMLFPLSRRQLEQIANSVLLFPSDQDRANDHRPEDTRR